MASPCRMVCALVVVFSLPATGAQAHWSQTSRMHDIRHIAMTNGRDTTATCGVSMMDMPITRTNIPVRYVDTDGDGKADQRIEHVAEFEHSLDDDRDKPPFHDCRILVDDREWDTVNLCTVVAGHEAEHAMGYLAPPGEEFIGPFGPETHHSRDPASIMWPYQLQPWEPCYTAFAIPR